MNNGDDINNLLKTLGHDAGLYQDLAKYNASRAALRRAAMVRPVEPVAAVPAAPPPAEPMPASMSASMSAPMPAPMPAPVAMQPPPTVTPRGESSSLSAILNRLSSPNAPAPAPGRGHDVTNSGMAPLESPSRQPTRLDRLFGRLSTRTPGALGR